ncbi:MAG: tripartite tricarboxylate transporter substrate binding protein [Rhodoferax sp.]|nr:tripartite tricarboxylate transporter substrate binding protein [Rhodoferax sp.]
MKNTLTRRTVLTAAALAATLAAGPALAQASFPGSQPIKLIVPYPAGGATDILARMMAQKLGEAWSANILVENKPGAGGTIGNNFVAKAAPDGNTVLLAITAIIQQPSLMTLPYDPLKDFAPITQVAKSPSMFAVPLNSPASNLKDFVAQVKASPGKFNFGSYGAGTSSHIQGSLLNMQAGLDMVHVPFQGAAPLVTNMIGGQLTSAFIDSASARAHLKSLKPLAVTGTQRMPALPDVPTFKELGYHSFDPIGWFAMFLPASTPAAIVSKYNEEANRILRQPDVIAKIEGLGLWVGGGKPEELAQIVKDDAAVYARIIKDADIKLNK